MPIRIEKLLLDFEAIAQPGGDSLSELSCPLGGRIIAQAGEAASENIENKGRRRTAWFAYRPANQLLIQIGFGISQQNPQSLKRIGLEFFQLWIHWMIGIPVGLGFLVEVGNKSAGSFGKDCRADVKTSFVEIEIVAVVTSSIALYLGPEKHESARYFLS